MQQLDEALCCRHLERGCGRRRARACPACRRQRTRGRRQCSGAPALCLKFGRPVGRHLRLAPQAREEAHRAELASAAAQWDASRRQAAEREAQLRSEAARAGGDAGRAEQWAAALERRLQEATEETERAARAAAVDAQVRRKIRTMFVASLGAAVHMLPRLALR